MMKNTKEVRSSLQLLLQLQKFSAKKKNSGYALLITSLVAILLFSMISAYLFSNKIYKSSANAMIDAGSTFYASEFGLNKRAENVRKKFDSYSTPIGTPPGVAGDSVTDQMANCLSSDSTAKKGKGDFECQVDETNYKEAYTSFNSAGAASNAYGQDSNVKYKSYSFVRPISGSDELKIIENGSFSGLRAQEYRYRVYSTAVKQIGSNSSNIGAQAMLQMEFINHYIPAFQFAAFYEKDLEITNSGRMDITGPIHTNENLYLAPGGLLVLNNRATYANSPYRSLSYTASHTRTTDGRRVLLVGGGPYSVNRLTATPGLTGLNALDVVPAWSNPNLLISEADVTASKGMLRKISKLQLPPAGFLSKTGEYRDRADLQIDFDPAEKVIQESAPSSKKLPFNVTSVDRSTATPTSIDFSTRPGLIDSLQKPVLLRIDSFSPDKRLSAATRLCPRVDGAMGEPTSFPTAIPPSNTELGIILPLVQNTNSRKKVIAALQEVIAKQEVTAKSLPISYESTTKPATDQATFGKDFRKDFEDAMTTTGPDGLPGLAKSVAETIAKQRLDSIAALNVNIPTNPADLNVVAANNNGGCFLPPPIQVLPKAGKIYDRKENFTSSTGREMSILQSNIKSLTVWNKDGRYWDKTTSSMNSTDGLLFTKKVATVTPNSSITIAKSTGNCDLECLGLAATDTTEGGLVWHYSLIDRASDPSYSYKSGDGKVRSDSAGLSTFGFAFSGGNRLPGPLTIASDQAIYSQGDYNNPSNIAGDIGTNANPAGVLDLDQSRFPESNPDTATSIPPAREKRPAAFLGDSVTILSNACYDANYTVAQCLTASNTALQPAGNTTTVRATVVRAAILSGTESTVLTPTFERGAALNNHIRMLEDWFNPVLAGLPNKTFKYRGSFVSKGLQTEFNGQYRGGNGAGFGNDYYGIPNRDFGYDTDFNRVDGLPPLTPRVNYLTQQVFKRDYDSNNR
jgi:hypothetical protein